MKCDEPKNPNIVHPKALNMQSYFNAAPNNKTLRQQLLTVTEKKS